MVNESELPINVVINEQPKMLRGCHQNGTWSGSEAQLASDVDVAPPAERQHLTYSGTHAERGKPVSRLMRESESRDEPIGMRAWESRRSECSVVMAEIEVETSPHAKAGRLRRRSLRARTDDQPTSEREADEGSGNTSLCASPCLSGVGSIASIAQVTVVVAASDEPGV